MARKEGEGTKLSVFKGREARLNRAIFQVLARKEPLTTREIRKAVTQIRRIKRTSYSTINKRVRSLEDSGYLTKAAVKERPGGIANYYELSPKAYLATFFNSISIEDLMERIDLDSVLPVLGALVNAYSSV